MIVENPNTWGINWDDVGRGHFIFDEYKPTEIWIPYYGKDAAKYQFTVDFGRYSLRFSDVMALQKLLVNAGYADFTPTGFFGGLTQAAVQKYQSAHGIPATGFVGPLSRASLNSS